MTLRRLERLDRSIAREIDGAGFDLAFVKDCRIAANPYVLRHLATPSVFQCHHGLRHRTERSRAADGDGRDRRPGEWLKAAYYAPAHRLFDARLCADEMRNIRSASAVLTNSRFSRELLSQHYSVRSEVVYPGIDAATFRPMPLAKMDYVLSVGALVYSKGYRFLVSALARIEAARRPALLVAANSVDPGERRLVEGMAAAAGVDLRVEVIADDDRLVQVYNQARVFVYAPLREALGMAPLEAMACGTPVVAVAEGGVRETVLDGVTGCLVPRDVGAFAARLEALLGDDRTRLRMGQAGVEYVRRDWTWQRAVDTLESHFHSLLGRTPAGRAA